MNGRCFMPASEELIHTPMLARSRAKASRRDGQGHFMKARNERSDSLRDPKPTPDLSSRAEGEGSRPTHVALARLPRRSPR